MVESGTHDPRGGRSSDEEDDPNIGQQPGPGDAPAIDDAPVPPLTTPEETEGG